MTDALVAHRRPQRCCIETRCRGCRSEHLTVVLPLGPMPLANALRDPREPAPEARYPLTLAFCEACTLVQILETVPPEDLFGEYLYFSSFSDSINEQARLLAQQLVQERQLGPGSLVVEIASNDGYLLRHFVAAGVPVLGIEPARNIARVASANGVRTLPEFFSDALAEELSRQGVAADLIVANNVMAHVPDIHGILSGVRKLLRPDGVFVMETPYVREMIDGLEFDTIYHEHLFYYSLTALESLFEANGLKTASVRRIPAHGGSLQLRVVGRDQVVDRSQVEAVLEDEVGWGVHDPAPYLAFARRVVALRSELPALLRDLKRQGHRLAAYGAAAKGATLLNYIGIGTDTLDFVVDRSSYKQGKLMPGVGLPIHPPADLLTTMPDYVLLLAWNMADEILAQQRQYRAQGGQFIVPVPSPRIVQ